MLTITLQGTEAEDYLTYRRTSAMLTQEPQPVATVTPVATPQPVTAIAVIPAAPALPKLNSTTVTRAFDNNWRSKVESGERPLRQYERWSAQELDVLVNAAGKTDRVYYSVKAISETLGRSRSAIVAAAIRLGYVISNKMLAKPN